MSDIHAEAFRLFLSESTALALIGSVTGDLNLASALEKRHKIRKADLKIIYSAASKQSPNTLERAITVGYLMLMAGGAYKSPGGVIGAPNLGSHLVTPHWDQEGIHELNAVYLWEPMNLWAGWGWENGHNASQTFDPHYHDVFNSLMKLPSQRSTAMNAAASTVTDNVALSRRIASNTTTQFASPPAYPHRLERKLSAHSANLALNESNWEAASAHFAVPRKVSARELKAFIEFLVKEARASTLAGEQHYRDLLSSMTARGLRMKDDYMRVADALKYWTQFRGELVQCLDNINSNWNYYDSEFF